MRSPVVKETTGHAKDDKELGGEGGSRDGEDTGKERTHRKSSGLQNNTNHIHDEGVSYFEQEGKRATALRNRTTNRCRA